MSVSNTVPTVSSTPRLGTSLNVLLAALLSLLAMGAVTLVLAGSDNSSTESVTSQAASAVRSDGGPDETGVAAAVSSRSVTPDESRIASAVASAPSASPDTSDETRTPVPWSGPR